MIRRGALAIAGLLASVALLAGCVPDVSSESTVPEVTVVLQSSTVSLNPYAPTLTQRRIGHLVFQGLLGLDEAGMPTPDLCVEVPTAANGGISDGGRTVRYRLGEARFHDGTPVTADDVVFTVERLRSGELVDEPGFDLSAIASVRAVDPQTVELRLSRPDAPLVWRLAPFVLPAHLLADSADVLSDPFWLRPVGSGSYAVDESKPGESLRLTRQAAGDGPASLDIAFVPSESAARTVFDDAPHAVWFDAPVGAVSQSESQDSTPGAAWWRFSSSYREGSFAQDPAVRWAVRSILESRWSTASADPAIGPFGFEPRPAASDVSTASVAARLERAGWTRGEDGVRSKNGRLLEPVMRTPALGIEDAPAVDRVKAAALAAGMALEVRPSGETYYGDYLEAGVLMRSEGDFFLTCVPVGAPPGYAWSFDPQDTPGFRQPQGLNWQRVDGVRAGRWTARIRSASTPEEAAGVLRDAWTQLERDDALRWMRPTQESVLAKRVQGVTAHPFAELSLTGCDTWRIAQ